MCILTTVIVRSLVCRYRCIFERKLNPQNQKLLETERSYRKWTIKVDQICMETRIMFL